MEDRMYEGDIDKGIGAHDQYENLGGTGNMVGNEGFPGRLIHGGVDFAIDLVQEEALK
jgi:hypothetical protein